MTQNLIITVGSKIVMGLNPTKCIITFATRIHVPVAHEYQYAVHCAHTCHPRGCMWISALAISLPTTMLTKRNATEGEKCTDMDGNVQWSSLVSCMDGILKNIWTITLIIKISSPTHHAHSQVTVKNSIKDKLKNHWRQLICNRSTTLIYHV